MKKKIAFYFALSFVVIHNAQAEDGDWIFVTRKVESPVVERAMAMAEAMRPSDDFMSQGKWAHAPLRDIPGGGEGYYALKQSGSIVKMGKGRIAYIATFKHINGSDESLGRYFVETKDCNRKKGRVWFGDVEGNANGNWGSFAIGDNTMNSHIAGILCNSYALTKNNKN
ncbi:hypothetical protein [Paludibacterium denitrificans]|uniref:DUF4879 domain-containing protein n=1 Tax=Paludibacterium denitrificans TaxID=2675226 RepID=A0A844GEU5_9NEIS|nr:hypothetical protein [Paludibacterium denitrificans]MTD33417.1 hypothetical protein [Paludibacterium denitrificans]